jgi:hypothetical protein
MGWPCHAKIARDTRLQDLLWLCCIFSFWVLWVPFLSTCETSSDDCGSIRAKCVLWFHATCFCKFCMQTFSSRQIWNRSLSCCF